LQTIIHLILLLLLHSSDTTDIALILLLYKSMIHNILLHADQGSI